MSHRQMIFSGADFGFRWVGDWYEYDGEAAEKLALKKRNEAAKVLKSTGWTVQKFSLGNQFMSRGGIGSGKPHIEFWTKAYGLNADR